MPFGSYPRGSNQVYQNEMRDLLPCWSRGNSFSACVYNYLRYKVNLNFRYQLKHKKFSTEKLAVI
jgi:hypothetical protein